MHSLTTVSVSSELAQQTHRLTASTIRTLSFLFSIYYEPLRYLTTNFSSQTSFHVISGLPPGLTRPLRNLPSLS